MKIIYFHGFASSGASGTVQLLRKLMPDDEVIAPDIPVEPLEALPYLKELCQQEQPDIIIGTSMGGMYAHQMRGFHSGTTGKSTKVICVNPAVNMSTMSHVLKTGEHKFLNGRKDNQKTFRITKDIIQHHNQIERQQFKNLTDEDKANVWGLFGIYDKTCNTYGAFSKHYPQCSRFEGEHQLNEKVLKKVVIPLIKEIS
jgi:predicted esterase YcpF (UPF0227 family)